MRVLIKALPLAVLALTLGSCGKSSGGGGGCGNCGSSSQPAVKPQVDLSGASGLFVTDPSQSSASGLSLLGMAEQHNRTVRAMGLKNAPLIAVDGAGFIGLADDATPNPGSSGTAASGDKSLQKADSTGNITSAMSVPGAAAVSQNNGPQPETLPKILTIAISPKKEVFLHFERAFTFGDPVDGATMQSGGDMMSDKRHCQLFKVKGATADTLDDLQKTPPSAANLECLTFDYSINSWNTNRLSVFQFDSSGNIYYPGAIGNSGKMVVIRHDRASGVNTEMINSNICVQDFLVTPSGGMFYTGTSACGTGSSGGFFRYISSGASSTLTEIARDWWQFIYEANSTATTDKAVFFGPDPTSASTASFDSACLFNFDPAGGATTALRTTPVITCGSDIWSWINMSRPQDVTKFGQGYNGGSDPSGAWRTEYASRCVSAGQVFAGGGSQISAIKQDSKGNIFVIGNVRKKNAGILTCSVEVRGPHCKIDGSPDLSVLSSATCTSKAGTWVDEGFCQNKVGTLSTDCLTSADQGGGIVWNRKNIFYSGVSGNLCTQPSGSVESGLSVSASDWTGNDNTKSYNSANVLAANTAHFRLDNLNCQAPATTGGDQWTTEYKGLAAVDATNKNLNLLSDTSEQAINLWIINDKVYYAAYNAPQGKYLLRSYDSSAGVTTMLSNFEVYNLSASSDATKLYFDGLDFSNNKYTFGTVLIASPYTVTANTGLTGVLKTVVILPK